MENQQAFAEQLFGEALDLPRAERAAFLAKACRDTPAVKRVVEALLEENDRLSGFLSDPLYKKAKDTTPIGLAPGTRLGRYTIVDQLGAGGMGVVYRARDEKLEREVAIKMVAKGMLASEEARRHFRREALALAKLNHAHIAAVYDVGEQDGADFLVMELVHGQSLGEKLRAGPLEMKQATAIARQVAEALGEAHERGVIHRDLKPANVMITPKGDAKVLDFGLAKLLASGVDGAISVAETRGFLGTPVYMSPEQALGKSVDARTDLWSLGVLYYESLAGRPPFAGNSSVDILHAITGAPLPSIRAMRSELPPLTEHIVTRALEKDCDLRYQRAAEMETDLKRLARDLDPGRASASSVSVAVSGGIAGARRSRRGVALLAGAAGLVLLLALAYLLRPTVPPLRVIGINQITHDGHGGQIAGTDGARIYFNTEPSSSVVQVVSVSGGDIQRIPLGLGHMWMWDVSGDGTNLLVSSFEEPTALWNVGVLGGPAHFITKVDENACCYRWSPDGKYISYIDEQQGLSVMGRDGADVHKIATMRAPVSDYAWSPDGGRIRFTHNDSLWEVSSAGANLHPVFPKWNGPAGQCCGRWTPDGNFYLFLAGGNSITGNIAGGFEQIWALDERHRFLSPASPDPVQLTFSPLRWERPFPSKDGNKIFARGTMTRGELVRFDQTSKQLRSFLGGMSAEFLTYSKDGAQIAYVTYPDGILWRAKADGTERIQLTNPPLYPILCHWSPDGSQILFTARLDPSRHALYVMPAQGGTPRLLVSGDDGQGQGDGVWSPDGRRVVYTVEPPFSLRIFDIDSGKVSKIPGSDGLYSPRWSPDGRYIAAMTLNSTTIKLFNLQTQQWSTLTEHTGPWGFPTWSHDGRFIYALRDVGESVQRISVPDGKSQRFDLSDVHLIGAVGFWFDLDPNDTPLLLRDYSTKNIYALTLDSK